MDPEPSNTGAGNPSDKPKEASLKVPSKDPKKKDEKKDEDLSEEDLALKQQLELYVERVQDPDPGLQRVALESMRQEIRSATSSMTSVPKPLKFLRPHYGTLKAYYETMTGSELKEFLADILSVLALTMSAEGERESLKYRLLGSEGDIGSWGHEYVRNLAGEIAQEYTKRQNEEDSIEDLMDLVQQIIAFHMQHNAEPEAVDLLMEVEDLDMLAEHVDEKNYRRTCLYLASPDDMLVLDIAHSIYMKCEEYASALQVALYLDNLQGVLFELDDDMVSDDDDRELCQDIINNSKLSEGYLTLARDIEVMEAKSPEDIYKIRHKLTPILGDTKASLDVIAFTAISLGLVFVGSCNEEVAQAMIFALMDRSESDLGEPLARLLPLGLGLLYLGKQESVEATAEVSKTFNEKIRKHCDMTLLSCAYAGTGNVLKVQSLLGHCAQHLDKGETHQGPAVLGIAMVAMAEELGLEMAIRSLEHLLQYGEPNIRRAVPLALGLLCISNPKAAIISLGFIGAGTNNARIAGMLRNLSSYYYKDASALFCVRIAQGLVHMGKGLLTLNPYHSDRFLLSPTALAGLVITFHACLDMKANILGKYHYMLYFLVLAMQPRMLLTVDENLKPLSVPVRVGQAVDVVGQAGRPKTITGFQTHSTPVLLSAGDRAELATEKFIPLSPILEGFVILKENPEYREEH
ncbi:26S proteasome non-ATPase regulatory subunit 2-like protein A [Bienertia sinuspersici]